MHTTRAHANMWIKIEWACNRVASSRRQSHRMEPSLVCRRVTNYIASHTFALSESVGGIKKSDVYFIYLDKRWVWVSRNFYKRQTTTDKESFHDWRAPLAWNIYGNLWINNFVENKWIFRFFLDILSNWSNQYRLDSGHYPLCSTFESVQHTGIIFTSSRSDNISQNAMKQLAYGENGMSANKNETSRHFFDANIDNIWPTTMRSKIEYLIFRDVSFSFTVIQLRFYILFESGRTTNNGPHLAINRL